MPLRKWMVVGTGATLLLGGCATPQTAMPIQAAGSQPLTTPSVQMLDGPDQDDQAFSIGPAATDTVGGYLPDGKTITPFDTENPAIAFLEPPLLTAIQNAARGAASEGLDLRITSGWRTKGFQQRLFDDAVRTYGNKDVAERYVASPETSWHVIGKAVDVGPAEADNWLIANGSRFGLCQIFANEIWHFELAADHGGSCPPLKPNAAG